jgi:hypothetical protein
MSDDYIILMNIFESDYFLCVLMICTYSFATDVIMVRGMKEERKKTPPSSKWWNVIAF